MHPILKILSGFGLIVAGGYVFNTGMVEWMFRDDDDWRRGDDPPETPPPGPRSPLYSAVDYAADHPFTRKADRSYIDAVLTHGMVTNN